MAVADVQQLTEDELRAKLYNSLQKKGILDSLKVQSLCVWLDLGIETLLIAV